MAAVDRHAALQATDDGQARHHGPEDLRDRSASRSPGAPTSSSRASAAFRRDGVTVRRQSRCGAGARRTRGHGAGAMRSWSSAAARSTRRRSAGPTASTSPTSRRRPPATRDFPPIDPGRLARQYRRSSVAAGEKDSAATRFVIYDRVRAEHAASVETWASEAPSEADAGARGPALQGWLRLL